MEALVEVVKRCDSTSAIYCAEDSATAYKYAIEERIDLFLVDIVLDNEVKSDVSGIIFADKIRKIDRYRFVPLIFVTSLEDYEMNAFRNLHCYGYIEKPFDFKKMKDIIKEALTYPIKDSRSNRYIYYRKDGILYSIDMEQIIYLEMVLRDVVIHMTDEEIKIPYRTGSSMLHELNPEIFLQCNRNVIVNRQYVCYVDEINRYIKMKNEKTLEIGRIFKKKFIQEFEYGG